MTNAHSSRPGLAWTHVRDSLWFVPSIAVVFGAAMAMVAVQIPTPRAESRLTWLWLFGGGAEGARGVLSAIAGSLITVTGVVFSVTIVALQLASSQFTPRVLRSFVADRVNQVVLGVFIGTFTYTLLVLRTIHASTDDRAAFIPAVGVSIALVLLLVSIGALIVFINHSARSVQASVILHGEAQRTLARITALFPEHVGEPAPGTSHADAREVEWPAEPPGVVTADRAGYLQAVHGESLWHAGDERRPSAPMLVRMDLHVGAFVFPGKPLVSIWPAAAVDEHVVRAVRAAFVLGDERTPEQDVEYGLVALSDIAVRALSPGINDPTTAMHCVDRLVEVLAALALRRHPDLVRTSPDRTVRFVVRDTPFDRAAGLAFDQIRHFGAENPTIAKKLLEALLDLARALPGEPHRAVLMAQTESVLRVARRAVDDPTDLAAIERLGAAAVAAATGGA